MIGTGTGRIWQKKLEFHKNVELEYYKQILPYQKQNK